jgi:hypothetical protein
METRTENQAPAAQAPTNGHRRMVDPFELSIPEREVVHREFRDWAQPGEVLALSLRAPDTIDQARLAAELQRMQGLYITGQNGLPPGPFPLVGGKSVEISVPLLSQACLVYVAQAPPEESRQERHWSPEHFVAWSVTMPHAWREILTLLDDLDREGSRAEGNSGGPPTAP